MDDEARTWAIRGWMDLFETINGEWGPYDSEHYLAESLPPDAPSWLRQALTEELATLDLEAWGVQSREPVHATDPEFRTAFAIEQPRWATLADRLK